MGSLSTQALALLIILSPGFIFLVGFHLAEPQYPSRHDGSRGTLIDTAMFAVTSTVLHCTVGVAVLALFDWRSSCSLIDSFAEIATLPGAAGPPLRCRPGTLILFSILYTLTMSIVAFVLGKRCAKWLQNSPGYFAAIYGRHYETFADAQAYVIANVMTDIEHGGQVLMYEGQLVELSLSESRAINYVVLAGASRFYMKIENGGSTTTPRDQFRSIDANSKRQSRLTIPGDKIMNLITRTHPMIADVTDEDDPRWCRRDLLDAARILRRASKGAGRLIDRIQTAVMRK
ncbi:hypothetical protein HB662_26905 [Roseomonas frigidaquae]|uniref:Uncharacterized protein n=1 Tax=Falsiroseomonas frigidaquae TaxID=487318 RepID=A0ABX1F7V8_9PROT|nr:hypothetical protein [Falsiroseomonas frigidaquae]NKE48432.1 hypothetical protein [Falsiroseomonas frigidaquae]